MTKIGDAELEVRPVPVAGFRSKLESQLSGDMTKAGKTGGSAFSRGFGGGLKKIAGLTAGYFAVGQLKGLLSDVNAEARESQKVGALSTQVIKSTGGAANVTAADMGKLATSISNKVGIDDEAIQSGENLLATFKNVRNEAGLGNKIFNRATKASVDMGAALAAASGGQINLRSSTTLLGKALNDPIKGLSALKKVGVDFTAAQIARIKGFVAEGKSIKAQKIILRELRSEFGGAAASQATDADKTSVSINNLKEQIGLGLLPIEDKLLKLTRNEIVPAVSKFVTGMQDGTGAGGDFVDVLHDTYDVGKTVVGVFNDIPGPVKKIGVEVLVAYVAIRKINSIVGPLASGFSAWSSSLRSNATNLDNVAGKSQKVGAGLRTLAGAAGLVAVQDGLSRTNTALSTLETGLGGAAAGFALGGPIGAFIGGVTGAGVAIGKAAIKADDLNHKIADQHLELLDATGPIEDYASTFRGATAAITKHTRALVYDRLESSGLLTEMKLLGLTEGQAVNAILHTGKARDKLSMAMFKNTDMSTGLREALRAEGFAVENSRLKVLRKNLAIARTKEEVDKAKTALREFNATKGAPTIKVNNLPFTIKQLRIGLGLLQQMATFKGDNFYQSRDQSGLFPNMSPSSSGNGVPTASPRMVAPSTSGPADRSSGSVTPRAASSVAAPGQRVTLSLFGQPVEGIFTAVADNRIASAQSMDGETARAGGDDW